MILVLTYFVNFNWVDSRWQQYSTHLHTNSTQQYSTHLHTNRAESFLRSWPVFAASQEIPCIFREPESSLPYSQVPANCPYPEPTLSSPHDPLHLLKDSSQYYSPIYVWVSPMASFPQVSPPTPVHPSTEGETQREKQIREKDQKDAHFS